MKKLKFISLKDFHNKKHMDSLVLYSYKVIPRVEFNYLRDKFYLYCYLDPFECYIDEKKILEVDINFDTWYFGYKPFYIGKASTRVGYRMNQHLNNFLKDRKDNNLFKRKYFEDLDKKLKQNGLNWNDYKMNYIVILATFENEKDLLECEMEFINTLGTKVRGEGILTNKITQYNQSYFREKEDF